MVDGASTDRTVEVVTGYSRRDSRVELIQKLAEQQKPDGHWEGEKRWMESDPVLSTAYASLALEEAIQDLKEHPVGR